MIWSGRRVTWGHVHFSRNGRIRIRLSAENGIRWPPHESLNF
jgi:hypothetical protein